MSTLLSPSDIASFYTTEQIQSEITLIQASIHNARESMRDTFGDTQANQTVQRQTLSDLNDELSIYIQAYNIKTSDPNTHVTLTATNYAPGVPRQ